jgi:hypothetical protein
MREEKEWAKGGSEQDKDYLVRHTHTRVARHWQGWARAKPKKGLSGDGIFRGWESQQMTINKSIIEDD